MKELLCYHLHGEFKMPKLHDKREQPDSKLLNYLKKSKFKFFSSAMRLFFFGWLVFCPQLIPSLFVQTSLQVTIALIIPLAMKMQGENNH